MYKVFKYYYVLYILYAVHTCVLYTLYVVHAYVLYVHTVRTCTCVLLVSITYCHIRAVYVCMDS